MAPSGLRQFHASRPRAASSAPPPGRLRCAACARAVTLVCSVWPQHGCQARRRLPWGSLPSRSLSTAPSGRLYLPQAVSACCRYPTLLWSRWWLRACLALAPVAWGALFGWGSVLPPPAWASAAWPAWPAVGRCHPWRPAGGPPADLPWLARRGVPVVQHPWLAVPLCNGLSMVWGAALLQGQRARPKQRYARGTRLTPTATTSYGVVLILMRSQSAATGASHLRRVCAAIH